MRTMLIVFAAMVIAAPGFADENPVQLKQAPGLDKVEANCGACHSLDHIQTNSPFLSGPAWDAEIAKMINAFGAPISEEDAKAIGGLLEDELRRLNARVMDPRLTRISAGEHRSKLEIRIAIDGEALDLYAALRPFGR
jgi:sulfite dehydrogenase (cytochrome) subunit B